MNSLNDIDFSVEGIMKMYGKEQKTPFIPTTVFLHPNKIKYLRETYPDLSLEEAVLKEIEKDKDDE